MRYRITILTLGFMLALFGMNAMASDMKFFKKAADKVWSAYPEFFNPKTEVPDSLTKGFSAVVLSTLDFMEADYEKGARIEKTFTKRISYTRTMVKLLDRKGVEDFSKHEFGAKARVKAGYYTFMKADNAFGARIHKPDGTVTDVDLSKSFAMSEGKEHSEKKTKMRKIDIPGLEPGDVLEYFTYVEDETQEFDPGAMNLRLPTNCPVLAWHVRCRFHPDLTVEYRGYNGAPDMTFDIDDKGYRTLSLSATDIKPTRDRLFIEESRQFPFYTLYTLNNTSHVRKYPLTARVGGLYADLPVGNVYRDISFALATANYDSSTFPGKLKKIVKNYLKEHPETTGKDLLKMAWTAAVYINITDKDEGHSDEFLSLMFSDIARKEKWADNVGVGFVNPRHDVPVSGIVNWRQPDYGVFADGDFYCVASTVSYPAGELPHYYHGEEGATYTGKRSDIKEFQMPDFFKVYTGNAGSNKEIVKCQVSFDDDLNAIASYDLSLNGATKHAFDDMTSGRQVVECWEKYLGITNSKIKSNNASNSSQGEDEKEILKEYFSDNLYSGESGEITDIDIKSRGLLPNSPTFNISFKTKMTDATSNAGHELILPVGHFIGPAASIPENERRREIDIYMPFAVQHQYDIKFIVPEGYKVDPKSVEALKRSVQNKIGMFHGEASIGDDGNVTLKVRRRMNHYALPASAWDALVEIEDAAAAFHDSVIILSAK